MNIFLPKQNCFLVPIYLNFVSRSQTCSLDGGGFIPEATRIGGYVCTNYISSPDYNQWSDIEKCFLPHYSIEARTDCYGIESTTIFSNNQYTKTCEPTSYQLTYNQYCNGKLHFVQTRTTTVDSNCQENDTFNPPIGTPVEPCDNGLGEVTFDYTWSPAINDPSSVSYDGVMDQLICSPPSLPSFPNFDSNTYLPGQSNSSYAYNFEQNPLLEYGDKQDIKYRISHYPTITKYLKVWIRKYTQNWILESCEGSLEPGQWGRIVPCCNKRWIKDGNVNVTESVYEWDPGQDYSGNYTFIYSDETTITPGTNQTITVIISKFSYLKSYEPDEPEDKPYLKRNGLPCPSENCCDRYPLEIPDYYLNHSLPWNINTYVTPFKYY